MSLQVITEDCLPSEFANVLCSEEGPQAKVLIRSCLETMKDINLWVKEFGKNTNTQWNSRTSCPVGTKIVCSKKFVCHQSGFMKVPAEANSKGRSKNAKCRASILIVIKLDTVSTRKRDSFMKGLNKFRAVITIDPLHSHKLDSAETIRFLQPSSQTKYLFFQYFDENMTISKAKKFHESLYESEPDKEMLLANGSINPSYSTVQNWYRIWRSTKSRSTTEKESDKPEEQAQQIINIYSEDDNNLCGFFDDDHLSEPIETIFISQVETGTEIEDLCTILKTCHEKFGSSDDGLEALSERLKAIKTKEQWESFLHSAATSVPRKAARGIKRPFKKVLKNEIRKKRKLSLVNIEHNYFTGPK